MTPEETSLLLQVCRSNKVRSLLRTNLLEDGSMADNGPLKALEGQAVPLERVQDMQQVLLEVPPEERTQFDWLSCAATTLLAGQDRSPVETLELVAATMTAAAGAVAAQTPGSLEDPAVAQAATVAASALEQVLPHVLAHPWLDEQDVTDGERACVREIAWAALEHEDTDMRIRAACCLMSCGLLTGWQDMMRLDFQTLRTDSFQCNLPGEVDERRVRLLLEALDEDAELKTNHKDALLVCMVLACLVGSISARARTAWLSDANVRAALLRQCLGALAAWDASAGPASVLLPRIAALMGMMSMGSLGPSWRESTLMAHPAWPASDVGLWTIWEGVLRSAARASQLRSEGSDGTAMLGPLACSALSSMHWACHRLSLDGTPPPVLSLFAIASAVSTVGKTVVQGVVLDAAEAAAASSKAGGRQLKRQQKRMQKKMAHKVAAQAAREEAQQQKQQQKQKTQQKHLKNEQGQLREELMQLKDHLEQQQGNQQIPADMRSKLHKLQRTVQKVLEDEPPSSQQQQQQQQRAAAVHAVSSCPKLIASLAAGMMQPSSSSAGKGVDALPASPQFFQEVLLDLLGSAVERWEEASGESARDPEPYSAFQAVRVAMRCAAHALLAAVVNHDEAHPCRDGEPRHRIVGCARVTCCNLAGPTDASLVVNNLEARTCGSCGVIRYCSAACASADWPKHCLTCRRLRCREQASKV